MEKAKIVFKILLLIMSFALMLYPLIYSVMNPELTQMQVFLKKGWVFLIALGCALIYLRAEKTN